jgi:hypothetical protein
VKTEKLKNRLSHNKQRRKAKEKEGKCCKIERKTRKKDWEGEEDGNPALTKEAEITHLETCDNFLRKGESFSY